MTFGKRMFVFLRITCNAAFSRASIGVEDCSNDRGVKGGGLLACILVLFLGAPATALVGDSWTPLPVAMVVGHRGSGYLPENTLASYTMALDLGADAIEPDLVMTKDSVLIARHENELSATTDVADHPEFADRKTTKTVNGAKRTGWFSEDFTYAEIQTLRATERYPVMRPESASHDEDYRIPSFADVLALAQARSEARGSLVWVVPELKIPSYFRALGMSPEGEIVAALRQVGWQDASAPVIIQSFSPGSLRRLNAVTPLRLAQIIARPSLLKKRCLRRIHSYADSVFVVSHLLIPRDQSGVDRAPTMAISRAKGLGLSVFAWTLKAENRYLSKDLWIGDDPLAQGDMTTEARRFFQAGANGVFTDNPDLALAAR